MPKKYIDSCGWKYQVMPGLGESTFKARYQRPEKHGDVGWKGVAAVPWRGRRAAPSNEKHTDDTILNALAKKEDLAKTVVDTWRDYF